MRLGNLQFRALFDPGVNVSVISASIAEKFKDRLQPVDSWIESAMGEASKCLGQLKVNIVVDGVVDALFFKALEGVRHEMILGMDFIKKWDIEVKNKQTLWRVGETILQNGTWYPFSNSSTDGVSVFGECAGIFELTSKEEDRLRILVGNILDSPENKVGTTDLIQHEIVVTHGAKPVRQAPRRLSPAMEKFAQEEVKRMVEDEIVEKSKSDWCSRPVIVKKANGDFRFCVDYRDLNKVTQVDAYPMRNMDSVLDKLRKARYISKIDLKSAFMQILVAEGSRKYTAFAVSGSGL